MKVTGKNSKSILMVISYRTINKLNKYILYRKHLHTRESNWIRTGTISESSLDDDVSKMLLPLLIVSLSSSKNSSSSSSSSSSMSSSSVESRSESSPASVVYSLASKNSDTLNDELKCYIAKNL